MKLTTKKKQIEASISDYKTGTFIQHDFEADEWSKRYLIHLEGLRKLKQEAPNWTVAMQNRLYKEAWYGFSSK